MTTRRTLFVAAPALAATLAAGEPARAQNPPHSSKTADFLFVQTAKGMAFDKVGGKLALEGVSPVTLFFADRPERIAGNMKTTTFVPFWSTGKDSFLSDPPNADLSILEGEQLRQVVLLAKSGYNEASSQGSRLSVLSYGSLDIKEIKSFSHRSEIGLLILPLTSEYLTTALLVFPPEPVLHAPRHTNPRRHCRQPLRDLRPPLRHASPARRGARTHSD